MKKPHRNILKITKKKVRGWLLLFSQLCCTSKSDLTSKGLESRVAAGLVVPVRLVRQILSVVSERNGGTSGRRVLELVFIPHLQNRGS